MTKDEQIYIEDILARIERVERYTIEGKDAFLESDLIQDGVIRNFEVMGEAVRRLGTDFTKQYPYIKWHETVSFRNLLIHDYDDVRLDIVWNTIELSLPLFKQQLLKLLADLNEDS